MLEGKQFYSWEIADVLDQIAPGSPASVEATRHIDADSLAASPPIYRRGDSLWNMADDVLSRLGSAYTATLVAKLSDDPRPAIQQSLTLPVIGGVALAALLGWWWVKR